MTHVPRLLPDEWAPGYWARLLHLNGVPRRRARTVTRELAERLGTGYAPNLYDSERSILAIANATQLSVMEVYSSHTLLPLNAAVSSWANLDWFEDSEPASIARRLASREGATGGSLCARCVDEDVAFWGFGYWRRSHQIEGVDWCSKHTVPLHRVTGEVAYLPLPHALLAPDSRERSSGVEEVVACTPFQLRLTDLCSELLQRRRPLFRLKVVYALATRVRLQRIDVPPTARSRAKPPARNRKRVPRGESPPEQHRFDLTRVFGSYLDAPPAIDYVRAIAFLYGSVEEALTELDRGLSCEDLMPTIEQYVGSMRLSGWNCPQARMRRLRALTEALIAGARITDLYCRGHGNSRSALEDQIVGCLREHLRCQQRDGRSVTFA